MELPERNNEMNWIIFLRMDMCAVWMWWPALLAWLRPRVPTVGCITPRVAHDEKYRGRTTHSLCAGTLRRRLTVPAAHRRAAGAPRPPAAGGVAAPLVT